MYGTIDWVGVLSKSIGNELRGLFTTECYRSVGHDSTWFNVPENLQPL